MTLAVHQRTGHQRSKRAYWSERASALFCLVSVSLVGCGPSAEELEQKQLERARVAAQQRPAEQASIAPPEEQPIEMADVPMSLMMGYDNLSPLMQGYFGDEQSTSVLIENLKRDHQPLQAPVVVNVKWVPMDLNRGNGVVSIVYDKPVFSFDQLQPVANALLKYRNYVGGAFDMRLLSFEMFIAGKGQDGCGFPLLNTSGLSYGLVSPCIRIDGEKICAKDDGTMTADVQSAIARCFVP